MIVTTRLGPIEGVVQGTVALFRNLPYAAPPLGELRFRAPEPPAPWRFTRDGREPGPSSPQLLSLMRDLAPQDEDCLHVNVWSPLTPAGTLPTGLPVLVFVHGGGFLSGASTHPMYDGRELAQRGPVVVVSFNYRLGALGFADLGALGEAAFTADANCGLHDQLAALRFVREHVEQFGGDPERVTLLAQSAGAMSAVALLTSDAGDGLFSRVIAQSGAAHHVTTRNDSARIAMLILDALKLGPRDLSQLRSLPWSAIVRAQAVCLRHSVVVGAAGRPLLSQGMTLLPVVDGELIVERPIAAAAAGKGGAIPLLLGTNKHEWDFWMFIADATKRDLDWAGLLPLLEPRAPGRAAELAALYQRELSPAPIAQAAAPLEPFRIHSAVETDCMFGVPALRLAQARANCAAPTFLYEFDWNGPLFERQMGACHSLELPFVLGLTEEGFGQVFTGGGPEARRLSTRMMDAWLAFARSGDPASSALPAWPRYTGRPELMALQHEPSMVQDARTRRFAFWDALI